MEMRRATHGGWHYSVSDTCIGYVQLPSPLPYRARKLSNGRGILLANMAKSQDLQILSVNASSKNYK